MKDRRSKIFIVFVVAILVFAQTTVFANTFSDVPNWAKEYVNKMDKAGIITGYDDGTFKPNNLVTREQATTMIGRMFKLSDNTKKELVAKYESLFNELGVSSWARDGLAICLSSGIVSEDVVKATFYTNKVPQKVKKEELCIYLTRAMGLENIAKNMVVVNLNFADKELMTVDVQAYVKVMVDNGVVGAAGDDKGNFNPKSDVSRVIMAKMCSIVYDYILNHNVTVNTNINSNGQKVVVMEGTIKSKMIGSGEAYLTFNGIGNSNEVYIGTDNTKIVVDGQELEFEDLEYGLAVIVKATQDKHLTEIIGTSKMQEYKGTIKTRLITNITTIKFEWKIDGKKYDQVFEVSSDCNITLNGENAFIYQVNDGDSATIQVKNKKITSMKAESKNREVKGVIKSIEYSPTPVIVIQKSNGVIEKYDIDNSVDVDRNNKNAEITDLKIGDDVDIKILYNEVDEIIAVSTETEDEGIIKAIYIANDNQITIDNNDREEITYHVANNAKIYIEDDEDKSIYDLRLGYRVELEIESNEITRIEAKATTQSTKQEGTITYLNEDGNIIVISSYNYDTKQELQVVINVTSTTNFINESGRPSRLKYLKTGNKILVIGDEAGGVFNAKTVIEIE